MLKIATISILGALILNTSCATIFSGTQQKISIDSDPQGAEIIIDGQKHGVTPAKVKVDREFNALLDGGKLIRLEMPGYKEFGYELDSKFNYISILNHFNPILWGIDIASGAITKYDNYYNFDLMPLEDNTSVIQDNDLKYDKLIKLKKLLDDGIITQEEYENEKAKILQE